MSLRQAHCNTAQLRHDPVWPVVGTPSIPQHDELNGLHASFSAEDGVGAQLDLLPSDEMLAHYSANDGHVPAAPSAAVLSMTPGTAGGAAQDPAALGGMLGIAPTPEQQQFMFQMLQTMMARVCSSALNRTSNGMHVVCNGSACYAASHFLHSACCASIEQETGAGAGLRHFPVPAWHR